MREIDPIRNPSEVLLSAALHRLASGSPQNASAELGADLAQAFRHHHRRRKQVRMVAMTAMAACLALVMVLLAAHERAIQKTQSVARQELPANAPAQTPSQDHAQQAGQTRQQTTTSSADENAFMPLDAYDPAMTPSELQVVRLELSGADLRLMGAPVGEDLSDRRLLADIVVGNDGTPYAVRIVQ